MAALGEERKAWRATTELTQTLDDGWCCMNVKNLTWSVEKLYDIRGKIDPSPQYQRGAVWDLKDKQLLIDSLLQNFDIPKIYLRKVESRAYDYEVADGQQRLRAIWEFMDDKYPIANSCPVPDTSGLVFSNLTPAHSKKLRAFKLVVAVAYKASSSDIRELFVRLQRGVPLSQPEIRNAIPSQLGDTIRMVASTHKFCTEGPFTRERYKSDDLVAHAFHIELTQGRKDVKAPDLRKTYKEYHSGVGDHLTKHVVEVMDIMHRMQLRSPKCITRKWGFVDVFWAISDLIKRKKELNPAALAARYIAFEERRLRYVSQPDKLLGGKDRKANRKLYDYIVAFKTSAGLSSNLSTRHAVMLDILDPTH